MSEKRDSELKYCDYCGRDVQPSTPLFYCCFHGKSVRKTHVVVEKDDLAFLLTFLESWGEGFEEYENKLKELRKKYGKKG